MEGRDELVTENLDLARTLARRMALLSPFCRLRVGGEEDLYQALCLCLLEAAREFDSRRHPGFRTFARIRMQQRLIDYARGPVSLVKLPLQLLRSSNDQRLRLSTCRELLDSPLVGPEPPAWETHEELYRALGNLPPAQRRTLELRFGLGGQRQHTWKEIAALERLSANGALARQREALDFLAIALAGVYPRTHGDSHA